MCKAVSTRKVITVLQKLLGDEISISSTQVSRCAQALDGALQAWRTRPLGETAYVFLDARYERVRHENQIVDCAVLVAVGVTSTGQRRVLGVSVALSEVEIHWRQFMNSLVERGLCGIKLIVSDAHTGLKAARRAVFPSVPWLLGLRLIYQRALRCLLCLWVIGCVAEPPMGLCVSTVKSSAERGWLVV